MCVCVRTAEKHALSDSHNKISIKMQASVVSAVVFAACAISCAHAWGNTGHEVTAGIADALISKTAAAGVRKILGEGATLRCVRRARVRCVCDCQFTLSICRSVATWADDVKDTPPYRWSAPLHYIDTPDFACSYDYRCVVCV